MYRIWQDQGSLSAKIDIRTDTSSYEFADGKKKNGNFCAQTPLKFDIVDRLYRGRGVNKKFGLNVREKNYLQSCRPLHHAHHRIRYPNRYYYFDVDPPEKVKKSIKTKCPNARSVCHASTMACKDKVMESLTSASFSVACPAEHVSSFSLFSSSFWIFSFLVKKFRLIFWVKGTFGLPLLSSFSRGKRYQPAVQSVLTMTQPATS